MSDTTTTKLMPTDSLKVTDAAVEAIRQARIDEKVPETAFLRVAVKGGGCSGLSYGLGFELEPEEGDRVVEAGDVRLLIDPRSEMVLRGTELDFTSGLNGKGFVFNNPNATGTCGCGNSFSV